MRITPHIGVTALLLGCASLGGEGGGAENLPNRGFAPYAFHTTGEGDEEARASLLPLPEGDDRALTEPFAFNLPGGDVLLLAELEDTIVAATSDDGLSFTPFETLITPDMDPDRFGDHVGAPSMVALDDVLILAFEYGDGEGVAAALSSDGGLTFELLPDALLDPPDAESRIASPTLARAPDGGLHIVYEQRFTSSDAVLFSLASSPLGVLEMFSHRGVILTPGALCPPAGEATDPCWDEAGISSPDLRFSTADTGRTFWRLTWSGRSAGTNLDDPIQTVGFAASFDGVTWEPYPFNPGLTLESEGLNLRAPAFHQRPDGVYLLYVVERDEDEAYLQLSVAINRDGAPSERLE